MAHKNNYILKTLISDKVGDINKANCGPLWFLFLRKPVMDRHVLLSAVSWLLCHADTFSPFNHFSSCSYLPFAKIETGNFKTAWYLLLFLVQKWKGLFTILPNMKPQNARIRRAPLFFFSRQKRMTWQDLRRNKKLKALSISAGLFWTRFPFTRKVEQ